MSERFTERIYPILFPLFLLLCGLRFVWGLEEVLEYNRWDESFYVGISSDWNWPADWSPLYVAYLKFFRLFTDEGLVIYHLHFASITVLTSLATYFLARSLNARLETAFLAGFVVLISVINFPIAPKVNHFEFLFLAALLITLKHFTKEWMIVAALTTGSVLGIFIRQEFIWLTPLLLLSFVFRQGWNGSRQRLLQCLAVSTLNLLVLIIAISLFGNPFAESRAWHSFRDHFFFNRVGVGAPGIDQYLERILGDAQSILEALMVFPPELKDYLTSNILTGFAHLPQAFVAHYPLIPPRLASSAWTWVIDFALLLGGFAFIQFLLRGSKTEVDRPVGQDYRYYYKILLLLLFARSIALIPLFEAYVRYYLAFIFLCIPWLAAWISNYLPKVQISRVLILPLLALVVTPNIRNYGTQSDFSILVVSQDQHAPMRRLVHEVRHRWGKEGANCLIGSRIWRLFGPKFNCLEKHSDPNHITLIELQRLLETEKIDFVVLDDRSYAEVADSSYYSRQKLFEQHYQELGYQLLLEWPLENTRIYVPIRAY